MLEIRRGKSLCNRPDLSPGSLRESVEAVLISVLIFSTPNPADQSNDALHIQSGPGAAVGHLPRWTLCEQGGAGQWYHRADSYWRTLTHSKETYREYQSI